MANGILIIDKPQGWTSMDVCAKLRGKFHEKRVGHGGTLDPMATGVLPVFLGRATRAVEFATDSEKEYVAALKLGIVTNTQDTTGEVTQRYDVAVTEEDLKAVLPRFTGPIEQIPPMYSAIKKDGKKLYELARKGVEVERKPRPVTIHALEMLEKAPFGWQEEENMWFLRVRCSKGTYIRTLCHDIGMALGCGAAMAALRRTEAGGCTLEESCTLEQVLETEEPEKLLRAVDGCFQYAPALTISGRE
ncbi:MAG: tRNA pseudouridine(55) synthase TruB, partial [Ruminococcaceae bacterium]|nr:tRNA pseudouridine(55) synthase TruB [Oscillospiraceae bacterium]